MQFTNSSDVAVTGGSGVSGAIYTITAGPAAGGYQTSGQSANRFDGLPPGTYTITISKPGCTNVVKSGVVVSTTYTALTLTAAVSNECANGQAGGTITATATGGSAPIQYAFVQSTDASIPDETLTYGPSSTTTTTSFGTYQVRAKDACGVFTTRSVTIAPKSAKAYFNPAGSNKDCNTYAISGSLTPSASGSNITPSASNTYTIDLFDVANVNNCVIPSGASPFQTITANDANDLKFDLAKTHPFVLVRTTSPCGEQEIRCYNLTTTIGPTLSALTAPACNQINGNNGVDILVQPNRFIAPLNVTITSQGTGTPVLVTDQIATVTSKLYSVSYVAAGYVVQVTDACSLVRSLTITNPPGLTSSVGVSVSTNRNCADQLGAKRTTVNLSGGITGLFESGSKVLLTSGPSGAISPALQSSGGSTNSYYWNNLAPGTYTAQITSTTAGCGPTSFTFTSPTNSTSSPGLTYGLTGSVTVLCSGNANLTTSFNYNGPGSVTYVTTNSSNTTIATNTTGLFNNLPPDVYTVKATAATGTTTGCNSSFTGTQSFTLTAGDSEPKVLKQIGVICENNGTPTTIGQAFFQFSGLAPYRLEKKLASSSSWSTVATAVTSTTYTVPNLTANSTYDFRLTDNCGKSVVTTVSIKPLDAQYVENSLQPCLNQNYTLSAPDLPGGTYNWTKDGNAVSANRQIDFTPYLATDDGQYIVTISLGNNCVARQATANLNSTNCGQALPVNLVSFTARHREDNSIQVDWVTATEQDNAYFEVDRSKDLINFEAIARQQPKEGGLNGGTYQYIDRQPYQGTSYYRLRQVDLSGKPTLFPAVAVVLRGEAYGVYPNPMIESRFTLSLDEPQSATIRCYTSEGRLLGLERNVLSPTRLSLRLVDKVSSGVYLLVVEERGQQRTYRLVVSK